MLDQVRAAQRAAIRSALSREQASSEISVYKHFDYIVISLPLVMIN